MGEGKVMRKQLLLWIGGALVAAGVAYTYWPAQRDGHEARITKVSGDEAPSSAVQHLGTADSRTSTASRRASTPPSHPFPEVASSRNELSLSQDPFGATSKAEQRWLDEHGFPNEQQWSAYSAASDGLLQQAAVAGDVVAGTMLDIRRLPSDPLAKNRLIEAGSEGNLFALNSLAAYLAGSKDGDLLAAYAVSRASEMKGDIRLGAARDFMMPRDLDPAEKLSAEADALRLYNQINLMYRERHGVDPPQSASRPVINQ